MCSSDLHRFEISAELIVATELFHRDVMCVHMRAGCDSALREADDLAVSSDWRSVSNLSNRDFVASPDVFCRTDVNRAVDEMVARFEGALQYRDIVIIAQQYGDFCKISFDHKVILHLR